MHGGIDQRAFRRQEGLAAQVPLDLDVQGVVVNGTGRSGVLMNGEVFEEGDYIADDLLVKMVEEEQIWFVFRGLTLVRTM